MILKDCERVGKDSSLSRVSGGDPWLRTGQGEMYESFPRQRGDYYKKESFPKGCSPNMGLAGNDSLEKPPMLLCTDPQKLDLKNLIFGGRFSFGKI